jgi:hypothetical protein
LTRPRGEATIDPVLGLVIALALTPAEQAQHHLYLANGYLLAGDVETARREAAAAARIDPSARLRCDGVRVPVRLGGMRVEICDLERASPPDPVLREVRLALARGDRTAALRLDPFYERRSFSRLLASAD